MNEEWRTIIGHPASGLRYQEWNGQARIIQNGHEIVSPSPDAESVYRQYQARFTRHMREIGHPDYQDV
ncbi:hypothetical protein ACFWNC_14495 [Streptomyces sp. NPDC058369]|uniref:hypothetical protein n=1 Tax=Streptomyces sp. NPDC058369 TaxID=3346462 RepID=UPI003654ED0F